jgi:hypothetical protein
MAEHKVIGCDQQDIVIVRLLQESGNSPEEIKYSPKKS